MTANTLPEWLPDLILLEDFQGDWNAFFDFIYDCFEKDFVLAKPVYRGKRLGLKRHPEYDGKSATFWHMMSEGSNEAKRTPDMRRCERICWPKPIIDNSTDPSLKVWSEKRGSSQRIHIWFEPEGYLVVLEDRKDFILPWTAFYIEYEHQRKKYNKRWERNKS